MRNLNPLRKVRSHVDMVSSDLDGAAVQRSRRLRYATRIAGTAFAFIGVASVVHKFQEDGLSRVADGTMQDIKSIWGGADTASTGDQLAAPTETTILVASPETSLAPTSTFINVGSIACYDGVVPVEVVDGTNTPYNMILENSPQLTTIDQAKEIYNSPAFNDANAGGFDPTKLQPGDLYNVPAGCVDGADGP